MGPLTMAPAGVDEPEALPALRTAWLAPHRRETLQRKQDRVLAKAYGGGRRPSRLTENYLEEDQVGLRSVICVTDFQCLRCLRMM